VYDQEQNETRGIQLGVERTRDWVPRVLKWKERRDYTLARQRFLKGHECMDPQKLRSPPLEAENQREGGSNGFLADAKRGKRTITPIVFFRETVANLEHKNRSLSEKDPGG